MGYVNKEGYERKAEWAARRNAKNAEIETLTPEQHEALAEVCRMRHEIHIGHKAMFVTESANYDKLWSYLPNWEGSGKINEVLSETGLAKIELPDLTMSAPNDNIWCEAMEDDDRAEYDDDIDRWIAEYAEPTLEDMLDKVNNQIEDYLRNIDKEHGTSYCPTGATRIY